MYGHSEFPGASYDRWKTTPPDNWYGNPDEPEDECDHSNGYDLDPLTGRAECYCCDHTWYLTEAQLKAHWQAERDYDRQMRREQSWWWLTWQAIKAWPIWRAPRSANGIWPRGAEIDDEIPF